MDIEVTGLTTVTGEGKWSYPSAGSFLGVGIETLTKLDFFDNTDWLELTPNHNFFFNGERVTTPARSLRMTRLITKEPIKT